MTEFQIYALDANNQRVSVCRDTKDFTNQQGRGKFQVTREKMTGALRSDGTLFLICEVEYFPPGSKISVEPVEEDATCEEPEDLPEVVVRTNNRNMWEEELFTDCVIHVGNKYIKAHRCILGQNSPVFKSMFSSPSMIEAQKGEIHIEDAKYDSVKAMVEFMYTGATEQLEQQGNIDEILAIGRFFFFFFEKISFSWKNERKKFLKNFYYKKKFESIKIQKNFNFNNIEFLSVCSRQIRSADA